MFSGGMLDLLAGLVGFLFTLMILSYVVGDNPLFRFAVHVFVGVSTGYVTLIVWQQVVVNKLIVPMAQGDWGERALLLPPLVMALFLLTRLGANQGFGRWVVAFLVGVGAAAAIAGALTGTLLPLTWASMNLFSLESPGSLAERMAEGLFILLGTLFTLAYFQFSVHANTTQTGNRGIFMRVISFVGEIFLAITFGALFAGVLVASLTALTDRMHAIVGFFTSLLP